MTRGTLPLSENMLLPITKGFSKFVSYMDGQPNIVAVDYSSSLEVSVEIPLSNQKFQIISPLAILQWQIIL